jgi:hypothetical protein
MAPRGVSIGLVIAVSTLREAQALCWGLHMEGRHVDENLK